MASNSDLTHQPAPYDASTVDSTNYPSPRPRHDSNALLMLPAPLSVSRPLMSSTSSVGVSRSSEDNYASDTGSGSNQRLISSPHPDSYAGSAESGQRLVSPVSPYDARFSRPLSSPPGISPYQDPNPFRSQATSPTTYEEHTPFHADFDDGGRGGRGVRLTDGGPVPGPDGVRRVSRQTGRRPSSQTPTQNRYSRNSTAFNLPPGAAPPQPNYGSN